MNKRVAALLCSLVLTAMSNAALAAGDAQAELLTIQKQWADARVKADIPYLERLYAKEFRVQDIRGGLNSREDDIAMFREHRITPQFVRDEDMNVSVYGESAIVTGIEKVGGTYGTGPLKGQYGEFTIRFSNFYVQRDGRWQLVLHHGTEIPKAP